MKIILLFLSGVLLLSCDNDGNHSTNNNTNNVAAVCGDDRAEGSEVCDGTDLTGSSCASLGFDKGILTCRADCTDFDLSLCRYTVCGDGERDYGEECDTTVPNGATCLDLGYHGGEVTCTDYCTLSTTNCMEYGYCGDGVVQPEYELCDGFYLEDNCRNHGKWAGFFPCSDDCLSYTMDCRDASVVQTASMETYVLDNKGEVWSWGYGWNQRNVSVPAPFTMPEGIKFTRLSCLKYGCCAIDQYGEGWCWGRNDNGQLGNGTLLTSIIPSRVTMPPNVLFKEISTANLHACALDIEGNAWCWGGLDGLPNLLGNSQVSSSATPIMVEMPPGVQFDKLSTGWGTLALDREGVLWAWGDFLAETGDLGISAPSDYFDNGEHYVYLGRSYNTLTMLSGDGTGYTFGNNFRYTAAQNGGSEIYYPEVMNMPSGTKWAQIDIGDVFGCAVDLSGTVWCWGQNTHGEVGVGYISEHVGAMPVQVVMPEGVAFSQVSVSYHSCAIDTKRYVWCWGQNTSAQIGVGYTSIDFILVPTMTATPMQIWDPQ